MAKNQKMFSVDKFLGLNEAADGLTELKAGQASRIENFQITDGFNLTLRPGIYEEEWLDSGDPYARIFAYWRGDIGTRTYAITVCSENDSGEILYFADYRWDQYSKIEYLHLEGDAVKIFAFAGSVFLMSGKYLYRIESDPSTGMLTFSDFRDSVYIPTVLTGCDPAGGGTALENANLLTPFRKVLFSCDGVADTFHLPQETYYIKKILLDNADITATMNLNTAFDSNAHTLKLPTVPPEGVNNLEITYSRGYTTDEVTDFSLIANQPFTQTYNGATDGRLFFYGNGNITYYTGVPLYGALGDLYVPAMNEIRVGDTSSPITAMIPHYSKMMVYKTDSTYSLSYSPMTLEDGSMIAAFYLRTVHKDIGNQAPGQVQLVNNYPRTLFGGSLYEWKIPASYSVDERYAKPISDPIAKTLSSNYVDRMVTLCDNDDGTYYIFLNDGDGTILVNRFRLGDVWTMYKFPKAVGVIGAGIGAARQNGMPVFWTRTAIYTMDKNAVYDDYYDHDQSGNYYRKHPIPAVWESGYMHFAAPYLRKYSSEIWVSLRPESSSRMTVTAATDRRDSYTEKEVSAGLLSWDNLNFNAFSFNMSTAPKLRRTKLKVKKFVYYKLIFRVDKPGARATVLGYDQKIRYAGYVK